MSRIELRHEDYFMTMNRIGKSLDAHAEAMWEEVQAIVAVSQDSGVDRSAAEIRRELEELRKRFIPELRENIRRLR